VDDRLEEWRSLLDPHQTAVLLVDVQVQFAHIMGPRLFPPVDGVLARIRRFIVAARDTDIPVVRIRAVVAEESRTEVWRRQYGPAGRAHEPLAPDAEGSAFHAGFEPQPGDVVITKHRYSAFFGTPLDSILRGRGVRTVVVLGLTTDVCVSTTARDAFQLEYNVVTLSDCTAEQTQARHDSGLATLAARFGLVCTSDDVLRVWSANPIDTEISVTNSSLLSPANSPTARGPGGWRSRRTEH
jgi:ureidoacrylate peracid hydrolase